MMNSVTRPELSIVLPAYREANSLRTLVPEVLQQARAIDPLCEILVVDSRQSLDETGDVCMEFGVELVRREHGDAYGDAVRTGIARSRGTFVLFMDADGSHNPAYIPRLWERREANRIVVGSRYIGGGATENPWILILMSWTVNVLFRFVLRLPCRDVSNSLRLYPGEVLRGLSLTSKDFDVIEEILVKLCAGPSRCEVVEIPMTFERRKAGKTKRKLLLFAIGYVGTLVRLWRFRQEAHARGLPCRS